MNQSAWAYPESFLLPKGWQAGAVYAGIKQYGSDPRFDLGLLASDRPCSVAGVFTQSVICGAPVTLCRNKIANGIAQAIVANSGCSNVAMGSTGIRNAHQMAELAAKKLNVDVDNVLVASTGVIGHPLMMENIEAAIPNISLTNDGGIDFARAIMTTDTVPKYRAVKFNASGYEYTVSGIAKGSGMIHPNMATVLCFITTDAPARSNWLQKEIRLVADVSLNMLDVDMDTSTSDTMLLLANGAVGGDEFDDCHPAISLLHSAIEKVAISLARDLARDGEGARTLIEVRVENAKNLADARKVARTVVSSPLVKTMVTGRDPNFGRVLMAVGRAGATVDINLLSVWIGRYCVFQHGTSSNPEGCMISNEMDADEVKIKINLGLGSESATAWGCDLTEEYVRINADYTT